MTMNKNKVKKYVKIGLIITIAVGLATLINGVVFSESTPSLHLDEDTDNIDMYDDKEFYYLTHNDDGTMNDYGKSLI
jgi:uncharacterized membrane protein